MARAVARSSADWTTTRQLVLERYGPTLGRALLSRIGREEEQTPRGHRSPRSGSVVLIVDKRTGLRHLPRPRPLAGHDLPDRGRDSARREVAQATRRPVPEGSRQEDQGAGEGHRTRARQG